MSARGQSPPARRPLGRRGRGYTLVELLMSLAVLAIGVSGIMAMQRVTLASNRHAKSVATATRIAQAWLDQLQIDATTWNHPSEASSVEDLSETVWLSDVSQAGWFRPAYSAVRLFGPAFDALGNPVPPDQSQARAVFCSDLRLTRVFPSGAGAGVIRTEVRVFWLRENGPGGVNPGGNVCDAAPDAIDDPTSTTSSVFSYHFIYMASAVRQQTLRR